MSMESIYSLIFKWYISSEIYRKHIIFYIILNLFMLIILFFFLERLINSILQVKQIIAARTTTNDSFPKENQELTNASEKFIKYATSMYIYMILLTINYIQFV